MTWQIYKVTLQLCSPLHMGCGKIGNLQRTRTYITGRALWGALTMRLTRDKVGSGTPTNNSIMYQNIGEKISQSLAFTYFFPALRSGNTYHMVWPWAEEGDFRNRFMSSYVGTALDYSQQAASFGMLHETEFISPRALDSGEPVFFQGYIFEKEKCSLSWHSALHRLQLGGERGYGWGDVKVVDISKDKGTNLFDTEIYIQNREEAPAVCLSASANLLAHTVADGVDAEGGVEPLVGREWRSNQAHNNYVGQHIEFVDLCFTPGSILNEQASFLIGKFGLWKKLRM